MNPSKYIQIEQIDAQTLFDKFNSLESAINKLTANSRSQETDSLLTRQEVADFLKVTLVTVWSWTNKGILQPYRIGNKIRYKKSEILNAPVPIKQVVVRK